MNVRPGVPGVVSKENLTTEAQSTQRKDKSENRTNVVRVFWPTIRRSEYWQRRLAYGHVPLYRNLRFLVPAFPLCPLCLRGAQFQVQRFLGTRQCTVFLESAMSPRRES